jgi:hypothetical protein
MSQSVWTVTFFVTPSGLTARTRAYRVAGKMIHLVKMFNLGFVATVKSERMVVGLINPGARRDANSTPTTVCHSGLTPSRSHFLDA